MEKLQYDSFYKFMVSVGVVLVATPLIGLYYLLCNGNQILISQIEYDALSTTSMQYVQERDQTILCVLHILPWALLILILCGFVCLIYGGIKWHGIQKELDEQTKLKTKEQKHTVEKLTASEIVAKVIDETEDDQETQNAHNVGITFEKTRVVKALEIERLCFLYVNKQNALGYSVQQNVKIKDYACDILAVSKIDRFDYIFEVKYWTKIPCKQILDRVSNRLKEMSVEYEKKFSRNNRCILMNIRCFQFAGMMYKQDADIKSVCQFF